MTVRFTTTPRCEGDGWLVYDEQERRCIYALSYPMYWPDEAAALAVADEMNAMLSTSRGEAIRKLPEGAAWSSSFGFVGEGGLGEFHFKRGRSMQAFHNDQSFKDFMLATVVRHREDDKIVQGTYWERGKGCAVGCTLEAVRLRKGNGARIDHNRHSLYESELGIPIILARLEDRIFEGLPNAVAQHWPERFISAIAPGADLSLVWPRFALWLLAEELPARVSDKFPKTKAALADVAALYREWSETGNKPERGRWVTARDGASQARRAYAAYAAYAADADAYAAADAAADAAAYAADADADAADAAAADAWRKGYDDAMRRHADKLIELLSAAPVIAAAA